MRPQTSRGAVEPSSPPRPVIAPGLRGVAGETFWKRQPWPGGCAPPRAAPLPCGCCRQPPPWRGLPLAGEAGGLRALLSRRGAAHWRRAARGDGVSARRRGAGRPRHAPCGPATSRLPQQGLVLAARGWRGAAVCKSCALRRFSIQPAQQKKIPNRYLGQPSPFTHPHLLKPGEVTPGLSQVEYALRRHKLMVLIQKEAQGWDGLDHTVILLSNPTYYMSNDIPYIFHQDTNFLYLCGFQEPDSILVLQSIPGKALPSHKSILFVPRRDPNRELWDGPRSGPDGAIALTGVDEAYTIEEFRHLVAKLKGESNMVWYDLRKPVHAELHSDYMQPLAEVKARSKNHIQAVRHLVQNLRLIKSPAEIERMKIAGRVTAEAFTETMFASKSPVDEAFLYAKFEFECRARGADILAYPPVVAGGNRSNTLHYVKNNQLIKNETFPLALSFLEAGTLADLEMMCRDKCTKDMTGCFRQEEASFVVLSSKIFPERYVETVKKVLEEKGKVVQAIHQCIYSSDTLSDFVIQSDFAGSSYPMTRDGELVLLDGGCEFSCYVSDITRTWPVNGRFTKPQAELYQAVLDIQKSCLSLCSPGMSLENIYSLMLSLIGQKLKDLGVLERSITDSHFFKAVRKYCPHHVGHYLGMDVHDTPDISRSLPFQPGMVITIEPGIYIPEDDASAPEKFRGIGVRIEDDVVITEDAPLVLSADCPKDIYHIEQICGRSS